VDAVFRIFCVPSTPFKDDAEESWRDFLFDLGAIREHPELVKEIAFVGRAGE